MKKITAFSVLGLGFVVSSLAPFARAGETALWPSTDTVLNAQTGTRFESLPDGSVALTVGDKHAQPGVRMDFKSGVRDLSAFGRALVVVSNLTERTRTVNLDVICETQQGRKPSGRVVLAPHAEGTIISYFHNIPWVLDGDVRFEGMNGAPETKGGSTFDLRKTVSFHVFSCQDEAAGGFSVRRIAVGDEGVQQKVLKADSFFPFVDCFGQFKHDDWPGKIHDAAELAADKAREDAWLEKHSSSPIPGCDKFGGWAAGPQLKATGFFRTEKVNGKWWLVDPEGHLFFSHGINCVRFWNATTPVSFREKYFEWLPSKDDPLFGFCRGLEKTPAALGFYKDPAHLPFETMNFSGANLPRKYGHAWHSLSCDRAHRRLRAWGINTIANWSSDAIYLMQRTPYTARFKTNGPTIEGSTGWWGKLRDPFAPEFIANAKKSAADEAQVTGSDPWCIGWFVDNELSWGHDDRELARALLRSPATQPGKKAFLSFLQKKYGTVAHLDAAWGTQYGSWANFMNATNVPNEKLCGGDLADMHRAVVGQYFRTIAEAIKAVAPNRLYLGSRIAWGGAVVHEECARYCDVVSVNIYSRRPDRDLPPGSVDKPMINGEFHFGALDRGMFHPGLVATRNQKERAQSYRDYLNACLDHPRFVGTHWFLWQDQALTGRSDGENFQVGFLSVTDTPYPELVEAARDIASKMYARRFGGKK